MPPFITEKPFVGLLPAPQNAVDIFAGEWASRFPAASGVTSGGTAGLFEDGRISWADQALRELGGAGFPGQALLELGPMEGGHSFMFERLGAREVVAVEANARAYLKCLISREIFGLERVRFLLGDAVGYLRSLDRAFDAGVCCAFLNHMVEPVEVIALLARHCRQLYFWSVVHDPSLFVNQPAMAATFGPPRENVFGGFRHTLYPHYYGEGINYGKFLGGMEPSCCWMKGADIIAAVRHFGFDRIKSREEDNPFGKAVSIAAVKSG